jgi:hypothetical protein
MNVMNVEKKENHLQVAVVTTSGSWPKEGFEEIPIHQKVKIVLKKATDLMHIVSTDNWVAKVEGREINPENNFEENNLSGTITIDFGPREGGGGQ